MTLKYRSFISLPVAVSLITLLLFSCKKDDKDPDYVGTWSTEQAVLTDEGTLQVKEVVTLTTNNYSDLLQLYDETSAKYLDYLKIAGDLTVNEAVMNVDINEVGITSFEISGRPTGILTTYMEGTSQFDVVFNQTGQSETFSFEYSVSGNSLTIYSDNNGDGDYADEDESLVFTKQ